MKQDNNIIEPIRGDAGDTVKPSLIPITMSRTVSPAVKCFSMCGVVGIYFINLAFTNLLCRLFEF